MENFKLNFKNAYKSHDCPLCGNHDDKVEESKICEEISKKEDPAFEFKEIFNEVIPQQVAAGIFEISKAQRKLDTTPTLLEDEDNCHNNVS